MKKYLCYLCVLCEIFALSGCIKSLEDEGVYDSTFCTGTIINDQNSQPVAGMRVSKTDGKTIATVVETAADGSFSIEVTPEDVHHNYYLWVEADSLYGSRSVTLEKFPYGRQMFSLGVVQVEGPVPPTVQTAAVQAIAANTAASGGNITDMGGSAVVRRGVCWSTLQLPTVADPHTTSFTSFRANTQSLQKCSKAGMKFALGVSSHGNSSKNTTRASPSLLFVSSSCCSMWKASNQSAGMGSPAGSPYERSE